MSQVLPPFKKPLKILYVAAANYTGTLNLFTEEHRRRGHEAQFVTLNQSTEGFDNGLCLNLRPNGQDRLLVALRHLITENTKYNGARTELVGTPPFCRPSRLRTLANAVQDLYYGPHIQKFIQTHHLLDYDIYHFEGGIDFFKDYRIVPLLKKMKKLIIVNYHGNDFRNRGVHPIMHAHADANITSEWDVHFRYPGSHYIFLPLSKELSKQTTKQSTNPIRICHLVRNKQHYYYKGTDDIIKAAEKAIKNRNAVFEVVSGVSHTTALDTLSQSQILIDQIGGKAGYGYGMSAVEALALGLNVCVEIQPEMRSALGKHPFWEVTKENLEETLIRLIESETSRQQRQMEGLQWVKENHSVSGVVNHLYSLYARIFHYLRS